MPINEKLMHTLRMEQCEVFIPHFGEYVIELGVFPTVPAFRLVLYRKGEFVAKLDLEEREARQLANAILLRVGQGMET